MFVRVRGDCGRGRRRAFRSPRVARADRPKKGLVYQHLPLATPTAANRTAAVIAATAAATAGDTDADDGRSVGRSDPSGYLYASKVTAHPSGTRKMRFVHGSSHAARRLVRPSFGCFYHVYR